MIAAAAAFLWGARRTPTSDLEAFWEPLFRDGSAIQVSIGQPTRLYRFTGPRMEELNRLFGGGESDGVKGTKPPIAPDEVVWVAPEYLFLRDALAAFKVAAWIQSKLPAGFSPQITPRDLQARLTAFAHDSMMGRGVGSVWNVKATDYMAAEFQRLGLKPAGDNGGWFQVLPYQNLMPDTTSRIETASAALVMGRDFVSLTPTAAARPIEGVRAVYGGLLGDSAMALSADQASRAIVVLQAPAGLDARRLQGVLRAAATNPRFAEAALIAIAMPQSPLPASRPVSTLENTPNTRVVPQIAITTAAATALLGRPMAGANVGAAGSAVHGHIGFVWRRAANPSRNVVAIIPGSDPALRGEYVSITAHNDHIGFNHTPVDHDSLSAFNIVVRPLGADSRRATPIAGRNGAHPRDSRQPAPPASAASRFDLSTAPTTTAAERSR